MSDTTITAEERAELRRVLSKWTSYVYAGRLFHKTTPLLLNALEQAEANVERLTKERDWLANELGEHDGSRYPHQWAGAARRAVADESEVKG